MRRGHPQPKATLVNRQEQLLGLCDRCRAEGRFALDTEFVMEDRYASEVCLIQIATEQSVAVIDPFLDLDLRPVWGMVDDGDIETVVHAGQEDLALAVQHTSRVPRRIFDVQIAAGLVGYEYPLSLQRLVQSTLHVRMHKSKTLTDWRKRPLTEAQIQYGAEDVQHLLAIHDMQLARLQELDRLAWAREEFCRFEEMSLYIRAEEDRLARVKGAGGLSRQQLAVVRELLTWRDDLAAKYNRPIRAVLKDHLLVEIARHGIRTVNEIRDLRGINLRGSDVRQLAQVVQRAMDLPPEDWPSPKPRDVETPREAVLAALATAVVRTYCMEHDLAYSLVATQRTIRELVRHRTAGKPAEEENVELLRGWRGRTVGRMLDEVLAGRRTVRVEAVEGGLAVHVTPVSDG